LRGFRHNNYRLKTKEMKRKTASNERFGVMAAVARRKCSGDLQLPAPQEVQWKPPLREAATTLAASSGQCSGKTKREVENLQ